MTAAVAVIESQGVIRLVLPTPPSANRWWRNVNGHVVKSKAARLYQAGLSTAIHVEGGLFRKPTTLRVEIRWFRERKSGDLDKRQGVLLDALQGIAYQNDGQIVQLFAERFDCPEEKTGVEVLIRPVTFDRALQEWR